jgi:hypothetical protein
MGEELELETTHFVVPFRLLMLHQVMSVVLN